MTIDKNIKEIRMNKIFSGVSDSEIDSLINPNNLLHINEGDVIYQTGDDTNELYLLLRGNVKIKFPSHNYISNKIFNDFFGEKELFENTR
ncbi:MAG: cyclic nucleotide-binding domain-containing protein [Bacteroidetes bacterium]|nr:cyclic nucleotide-binding domain-containing protein [Bacteroidota bacterium]